MGFNRCPFQLRRSHKRHEENKRKIGQERCSMQQVDYQYHRPTPWMQESVSMKKSPTPVRHSRMNQARSEEEEKKREGRQKRQRPGGWWIERQHNKAKTYLFKPRYAFFPQRPSNAKMYRNAEITTQFLSACLRLMAK